MVIFTVSEEGKVPFQIHLKGRELWALQRLIRAGARGCTPISEPAPRWSSYVHKLRRQGVAIETITESHEGPFPGHHARYVLRSTVAPQGGDA